MNTSDIALVTYTNSKCQDVLNVHLTQLDKFAPSLRSDIFSDSIASVPANSRHVLHVYDPEQPYWRQWTSCLQELPPEVKYIVYLQEDFLLYDHVDLDALAGYRDFLESSEKPFVRLIRSGFDARLDHVVDDLYEVNHENEDVFQMQATLWRRFDIERLYVTAQSEKWLEGSHWREAARKLQMFGTYCYRNEPKRGKYHWDSSVWPYVCTAVSRGRWNLLEYPRELGNILSQNGVDPNDRGVRRDYP